MAISGGLQGGSSVDTGSHSPGTLKSGEVGMAGQFLERYRNQIAALFAAGWFFMFGSGASLASETNTSSSVDNRPVLLADASGATGTMTDASPIVLADAGGLVNTKYTATPSVAQPPSLNRESTPSAANARTIPLSMLIAGLTKSGVSLGIPVGQLDAFLNDPKIRATQEKYPDLKLSLQAPAEKPFEQPYGALIYAPLRSAPERSIETLIGADRVTPENLASVLTRLIAPKNTSEDKAWYEVFVKEYYRILTQNNQFTKADGSVDRDAILGDMQIQQSSAERWVKRIEDYTKYGEMERVITALNGAIDYIRTTKWGQINPFQLKSGITHVLTCVAPGANPNKERYADDCSYVMTWIDGDRSGKAKLLLKDGSSYADAPWNNDYYRQVYKLEPNGRQQNARSDAWGSYLSQTLASVVHTVDNMETFAALDLTDQTIQKADQTIQKARVELDRQYPGYATLSISEQTAFDRFMTIVRECSTKIQQDPNNIQAYINQVRDEKIALDATLSERARQIEWYKRLMQMVWSVIPLDPGSGSRQRT